jgi:transcriptional regulator with XRE-family HTH domain
MDPAAAERLYKAFGQRVRDRRTKNQLSQEALGQEIGLSRTSVTNIERGHQHISLHTLYTLSDVLGVDVSTLLPDKSELVPKGGLSERLEKERLPEGTAQWIESVVSKDGERK